MPAQLLLWNVKLPDTCFPDCSKNPVSFDTVEVLPLVLVSATCQFPESAPLPGGGAGLLLLPPQAVNIPTQISVIAAVILIVCLLVIVVAAGS